MRAVAAVGDGLEAFFIGRRLQAQLEFEVALRGPHVFSLSVLVVGSVCSVNGCGIGASGLGDDGGQGTGCNAPREGGKLLGHGSSLEKDTGKSKGQAR